MPSSTSPLRPRGKPDPNETVAIGPECFAYSNGAVLCWRGRNYVPQAPEHDDRWSWINLRAGELYRVMAGRVDGADLQQTPEENGRRRLAKLAAVALLELVEHGVTDDDEAPLEAFLTECITEGRELVHPDAVQPIADYVREAAAALAPAVADAIEAQQQETNRTTEPGAEA